MYNNQKGFAHLFVVIGVVVIAIAGIGYSAIKKRNKTEVPTTTSSETGAESPTPSLTLETLTPSVTKASTLTKVPSNKPSNTPTTRPQNSNTNTNSSNTTQNPTSQAQQNVAQPTATSAPPTATSAPAQTTFEHTSGSITARVNCGSPIVLIVIDNGVSTQPNGVWTYVVNPQGENVYLAYTGPSASNASATVYGSTTGIRNGTQIVLESGKSYTAKFSHGSYTTSDPTPLLTDTIAQVTFTINC